MANLLLVHLATLLIRKDARCAVAESCTGGLISAAMTNYPGSSQWFDCGLVTYSNNAKQQFLGVSSDIIAQYGAVSQETVTAMAEGILQRTQVQFSLAVSGIAGPEGGSLEKPVGTIWFAWAGQGHPTHTKIHHLSGTRTMIRKACVSIAVDGLLNFVGWPVQPNNESR